MLYSEPGQFWVAVLSLTLWQGRGLAARQDIQG